MTATNIFYNFVGFRYSPPVCLGRLPPVWSASRDWSFLVCLESTFFNWLVRLTSSLLSVDSV